MREVHVLGRYLEEGVDALLEADTAGKGRGSIKVEGSGGPSVRDKVANAAQCTRTVHTYGRA